MTAQERFYLTLANAWLRRIAHELRELHEQDRRAIEILEESLLRTEEREVEARR
ncbi:unnamed protein product [marine sediment metagenome]|uniref:Uncharacterized protein n=1 Tax=marine sediment metagenome TaxID=412755 RepID=X0UD33_9ZZZZ